MDYAEIMERPHSKYGQERVVEARRDNVRVREFRSVVAPEPYGSPYVLFHEAGSAVATQDHDREIIRTAEMPDDLLAELVASLELYGE
jgi:hypothetical protein